MPEFERDEKGVINPRQDPWGLRVSWSEGYRADLTMDEARQVFGLGGTPDDQVKDRMLILQNAGMLPFSVKHSVVEQHRERSGDLPSRPRITSIRVAAEPEQPPDEGPAACTLEWDYTTLRILLRNARWLTEPGEPNHEYIRGQINLIMDAMGLAGDDLIEGIMWEIITRETTMSRGMAAIRRIINDN